MSSGTWSESISPASSRLSSLSPSPSCMSLRRRDLLLLVALGLVLGLPFALVLILLAVLGLVGVLAELVGHVEGGDELARHAREALLVVDRAVRSSR
jgi:hypothetical protein